MLPTMNETNQAKLKEIKEWKEQQREKLEKYKAEYKRLTYILNNVNLTDQAFICIMYKRENILDLWNFYHNTLIK